jgi:hypothetical protein
MRKVFLPLAFLALAILACGEATPTPAPVDDSRPFFSADGRELWFTGSVPRYGQIFCRCCSNVSAKLCRPEPSQRAMKK